jgi:hypothetical protein
MGTYITMPASTTADLMAYVGGFFGDLWVLIALAIGVPLAFYIISRVIGVVRSRTSK